MPASRRDRGVGLVRYIPAAPTRNMRTWEETPLGLARGLFSPLVLATPFLLSSMIERIVRKKRACVRTTTALFPGWACDIGVLRASSCERKERRIKSNPTGRTRGRGGGVVRCFLVTTSMSLGGFFSFLLFKKGGTLHVPLFLTHT
ncbi:hypothetical protein F4775DRAFT_382563 [Biscogniauxia sp. FL1348]|nr:hypothetical protein F4775DRAFT_382563 [Biscogniauxia sp. FL1348]